MSLNPHLPDELERLATDVRVERHGDPYLAFVGLMQPDGPPAILCVGFDGSPAFDMAALNFRRREDKVDAPGSAVLPLAELRNAGLAIDDLLLGVAVARPERGELSATIRETMADARERRERTAIERTLAQADHEAKNPAKCSFCGQRFTERGVKRHESKCYRNPGAMMYSPGGGFDPVLKDGKVVGYSRRGATPCTRCPDALERHDAETGRCMVGGCPCG